MNRIRYLAAICILCLFVYCSSSQKLSYGMKHFAYDYNGKSYTIYSYTLQDKVGYNLLISNETKQDRLKAKDLNQDGVIDTVITGSLSLAEAEQIYQVGLNKAQSSGNLENREITRWYETEDQNYKYSVQTYLPLYGEAYNNFMVTEKKPFGKTYFFKDMLADGSLDSVITGKAMISSFQPLYDYVLKQAIHDKKLEKHDEYYYVSLK
jgi:hypothetical protein